MKPNCNNCLHLIKHEMGTEYAYCYADSPDWDSASRKACSLYMENKTILETIVETNAEDQKGEDTSDTITPTITKEELLIKRHQDRIDRLEKVVKLMEEQIKQLNKDMFYLKGQHGKC